MHYALAGTIDASYKTRDAQTSPQTRSRVDRTADLFHYKMHFSARNANT